MKLLILLSTFLITSSFATEIERIDACGFAEGRVERIQREISSLTAEIIREEGGPEDYINTTLSSSGFNCEEVPSRYETLTVRRKILEAELELAQHERERSCPRYEHN